MGTLGGRDAIDLVVNGARLAEAPPSDLRQLERPLRPLALATSPILLRGPSAECLHVIKRLHALSRRAEHPLRICEQEADAASLLALTSPEPPSLEAVAGTWALFGVHLWPLERQILLNNALEILDQHRLAGDIQHEHIPRVLVAAPSLGDMASGGGPGDFAPELLARLSFFKLELNPRFP